MPHQNLYALTRVRVTPMENQICFENKELMWDLWNCCILQLECADMRVNPVFSEQMGSGEASHWLLLSSLFFFLLFFYALAVWGLLSGKKILFYFVPHPIIILISWCLPWRANEAEPFKAVSRRAGPIIHQNIMCYFGQLKKIKCQMFPFFDHLSFMI